MGKMPLGCALRGNDWEDPDGSPFRPGAAGMAHARRAARRAGLADQDRALHRAVRSRRDAGHDRAADRRQAATEARAELRGREQGRRERHDRHRRGRQGRAGRPHHRHQPRRRARDQHAAVLQDALRPGEGDRADHDPDQPAERARGAGEPRGQQRRRAGRAAEEGPRQIQFRLDRQRLAVASRHGGDRAEERHEADPRALRLLAAGDDRADPRRRADGGDAGDLGACRTRSPAR